MSNLQSHARNENVIEAHRVATDFPLAEFDDEEWNAARPVQLARYWSGETAPPERRAEARLVWSGASLTVRFVCRQGEPPVVNPAPRTEQKTIGLWERDVCELFIAPGESVPERYFEFEAAPTGEWLDLALRVRAQGRETDWNYRSQMQAAARVSSDVVTIALRVPWRAFGRVPRAGERWRANLFRCVGAAPHRGYVAWQPTHTPEPNFHVPQKFGWLNFKERT